MTFLEYSTPKEKACYYPKLCEVHKLVTCICFCTFVSIESGSKYFHDVIHVVELEFVECSISPQVKYHGSLVDTLWV